MFNLLMWDSSNETEWIKEDRELYSFNEKAGGRRIDMTRPARGADVQMWGSSRAVATEPRLMNGTVLLSSRLFLYDQPIDRRNAFDLIDKARVISNDPIVQLLLDWPHLRCKTMGYITRCQFRSGETGT